MQGPVRRECQQDLPLIVEEEEEEEEEQEVEVEEEEEEEEAEALTRDSSYAPHLHLNRQLYTGLVRQAKPVMTITTCLTYGLIKESIDDHYKKHPRRQCKVLKMVVHFRR